MRDVVADISLDPRLTPARPDLAAESLRGRVTAERFVEGQVCQVSVDVVDLKRSPRPDASVDTQLLFGELVTVFDEDEGWSWVQAGRDAYVGYVPTQALGRSLWTATHRVIVNRTFVYPAADMKRPILSALPLDGRVTVVETAGVFSRLSGGGHVIAAHLAPVEQAAPDFVAVAEQLIGAPYLWGGKSAGGIDCSGLVQLALSVANHPMPRDTDLQERQGCAVALDATLSGLRRGDLVFWKGHVGLMIDGHNLLHANGNHMLVMRESLHATQERIAAATGSPISSIRRLNLNHLT